MFLAVIVAGAVGLIQRNVVAVAGRGRPARRPTYAYRWRPVLRDEDAAAFTERSLPGKWHSDRCDPNTYVPLRPDALEKYMMRGEAKRRTSKQFRRASRNISLQDATPIYARLIVQDFLRPYQTTVR